MHDQQDALLQVDGLVKSFRAADGNRHRAVDHVDLSIPRGGSLGLVGPSGSGKTTLGRAILRLVEPDAGRVTLDGSPVTGLSPRALRRRRREMQIVFQDPLRSLSPRRTVAQSLMEPLEAAGLPHRGTGRATALLEMVGLDGRLLDSYPHELSGGQCQRVAIARALGPSPSLLVADEPVSALDVSVQAQILNLLADLRRELDLTLLFISHDLAVVRYIADTVAVMDKGAIVERGPVASVLADPQHPRTRAMLAAIPNPFD